MSVFSSFHRTICDRRSISDYRQGSRQDVFVLSSDLMLYLHYQGHEKFLSRVQIQEGYIVLALYSNYTTLSEGPHYDRCLKDEAYINFGTPKNMTCSGQDTVMSDRLRQNSGEQPLELSICAHIRSVFK